MQARYDLHPVQQRQGYPMMQRHALAGVFASAVMASPALAQDIRPEQAAFRTGYSHAKIETFAAVAREVAAIRRDAMTRYFDAEDDAARKALIADANAELRRTVEAAEGLSMAEFERINAEARTDKNLNRNIARALRALDGAQ